jgi:hypothetical protein
VQYLANSTDTANAEKATACQAFIAHVNVLLSDAKKRLEQRLSGGDAEGEGSNTGEEGDQGGSNNGDSGANNGSTENNGGTSSGGNGGTNTGSNPSNSASGGNSSDLNKPSEGGVVNGDEVSF